MSAEMPPPAIAGAGVDPVNITSPEASPPGNTHRAGRIRKRIGYISIPLALLALPFGYWWWHQHRIDAELREAETAISRYDLDAAALHLDRYIAAKPDDAQGWFLAARTARRRERFADAKRFLERCQELGGVTDSTRLEWDLMRVQQGDLAGIDMRLRATIGPDHPDALLVLEALARGYIRAERITDALEACQLWIARQPDHPWPYLWRGTIYERLNHLDLALPDFQRAVENAPDDRDARVALGGLYLRQRQATAASEHFERILTRNPDDVMALIGVATCRIEQGRSSEAVPLLDRALEREPKSSQAQFLRGKVAIEQDQPARALPLLREAARMSPNDPEVLYQLSLALRALHQNDEATTLAKRADQLRAEFVKLDELTRQIGRKPDDPKLRHEAGVLAMHLGRTEEGLRWLQSLLSLKGDHRASHAILAEYYRGVGNIERAEYHKRLAGTP